MKKVSGAMTLAISQPLQISVSPLSDEVFSALHRWFSELCGVNGWQRPLWELRLPTGILLGAGAGICSVAET